MKVVIVAFLVSFVKLSVGQGIYAPAAGQTGTTAIHKDSSIIVSWASSCHVIRGLKHIDSAQLGYASQGVDSDALAIADGKTVSLGDSGVATIQFDGTIYDGAGADFVIYENAFDPTFLELAYVYVTSDGVAWDRFDYDYTDPRTTQIGPFGASDPTHIHNLAGKYEVFYGTPFDLSDLRFNPSIDKNAITQIRIVDAIGDKNRLHFLTDSVYVNDPFPTPYESGGFDLDAIAAIHLNPATSIDEEVANTIRLYPNPSINTLNIIGEFDEVIIINTQGLLVSKSQEQSIDVSGLSPGVYFANVKHDNEFIIKRFIKK